MSAAPVPLQPLPADQRIRAALRLEPMDGKQLAVCLSLPYSLVLETLEIMQANAAARFLPPVRAWINLPRRPVARRADKHPAREPL